MGEGEPEPCTEDELQAYIDGVLPEPRRGAVLRHLADHPTRRAEIEAMIAQRDLLREALHWKIAEPVPRRLRVAEIAARRRQDRRGRWAIAASVIASVSIGMGAGWFGRGEVDRRQETLVAETAWESRAALVASAHKVFVADAFRPVEIFATSGDVVIRWLTNRLGRPVEIPDLSGLGLRFLGGRLIPTLDGPAAQLMYEGEGGVRTTVFMVPTPAAVAGPSVGETRFGSFGGIGTLSWSDERFSYTAAAVAEPTRLEAIAEAVRASVPRRAGGRL